LRQTDNNNLLLHFPLGAHRKKAVSQTAWAVGKARQNKQIPGVEFRFDDEIIQNNTVSLRFPSNHTLLGDGLNPRLAKMDFRDKSDSGTTICPRARGQGEYTLGLWESASHEPTILAAEERKLLVNGGGENLGAASRPQLEMTPGGGIVVR